ncbi:MAG TPA: hypothetical protein GXX56_05195 [Rhodocyclaceae bacterium]|nr:hypothetical protein [Rhodocyclaceae bacterium]
MRKFIGIFLLMAWSSAHAGLESINPMSWFVPKDASNYATKMAATIKDTPACQRFKDEIMAHAKGSPTDGKTVGPIVEARRKATEAGCAK